MTIWNPEWKISVDGSEYTSTILNNVVISSGRNDINSQPKAGYCQFEILNYENQQFDWNVGTSVSIAVKNSTGTFIPLFGGFITDIIQTIKTAGSVQYFTSAQITALGALSKLPKAITDGVLSQDQDGDQIYSLLSPFLTVSWNEVSPTETWDTTSPTVTWTNAGNLGLGTIDRPGQFTLENRSAQSIDLYSLISDIATSALGYIYEDPYGNISYADAAHRQDYLSNNGYVEISTNDALWNGIKTVTRSGDIRNKIAINYGNNFGSQKTSINQTSIDTFGLQAETINSLIHDNTDAQTIADRYIALRAFPNAKFDSLTYPLGSPELSDSDRDALLSISMGLPIRITDLPANISGGQFEGFVEGWTFRSTVNGLSLTLNASPVAFSLVTVKWDGVSASEAWNTLSSTLTWETAIGAVA